MMTLRKTIVAVSITTMLLAFAPQILTSRGADERKPSKQSTALAQMDWLAGTWSGPMWGGEFVAFYSTPEGGKILSYSKLLKNGEPTFYEFELFEVRDGVLTLQPFPGGRPAASFTLASYSAADRKAVFENPNKDFPTRIEYHRAADDNLVITLTDPHGESDKIERFDLRAAS